MIRFGWVYGISTIIGYLIPVCPCVLNMFCKHIFLITFLNEPELNFLHAVKWFEALLSNTNNTNRP